MTQQQNELPDTMLDVQWFTDPLCSWSYAADAAIHDFLLEFQGKIRFHHRMIPLFESLERFLSAHGMNSPAEFTPKIQKTSKATGVFMSPVNWEKGLVPNEAKTLCRWGLSALSIDPVKGDRFLSSLRHGFFVTERDLTSSTILRDIARESGLDPDAVEQRAEGEQILQKLNEDIARGKEEGVSVRPTLVMVNSGGDRVFIGGLRDRELFRHAAEVLLREA